MRSLAANSVSGPNDNANPSSTLFVLFFQLGEGLFYCKLQFDRNATGQCIFNINEFSKVELGAERIDFSGSGSASLNLQEAAGVRNLADAYYGDVSLRMVFPSLVSNFLSAEVRRQQRYEAAGVGGAFFGFLISGNEILPSADAIHIFADETETIRIFCKVLYREGIFAAKNFITGELGGFYPLNIELAKYRGQTVGPFVAVAKETNRLEAEATLFDVRIEEQPNSPNVKIYDRRRGNGCFFGVESDEVLGLDMKVAPGYVIDVDFGEGRAFSLRIRR